MFTRTTLTPFIPAFKVFLNARGAEVLEPTNEWELVRFKSSRNTSIVYTNKKGEITFYGAASEAWLAFRSGSSKWRAMPSAVMKRSKPETNSLRARDGHLCFYCQLIVNYEDESQEHLLSTTHGGPDHIANKALSHKDCNMRAGHLSLKEKINIHVAAVIRNKPLPLDPSTIGCRNLEMYNVTPT